jgi:hypothetical protein
VAGSGRHNSVDVADADLREGGSCGGGADLRALKTSLTDRREAVARAESTEPTDLLRCRRRLAGKQQSWIAQPRVHLLKNRTVGDLRLIAEVKARPDVRLVHVTAESHVRLPWELERELRQSKAEPG